MDILWIWIMSSVWRSKPFKNPQNWEFFKHAREVTLFLSGVNIAIKAIAAAVLVPIYRGKK